MQNPIKFRQARYAATLVAFTCLFPSAAPSFARVDRDHPPLRENQEAGNVLPPQAKPGGYSLADAAEATAVFNVTDHSGTPPNMPFQMLYTTSTNSFDVAEGTPLYVPVIWVDDSPPVIGNFPDVADRSALVDYFYSQAEFGTIYTIITVDGRDISLDQDYLVGMKVPVPGLPDGGGTQYITVAAFLAPLAKGQHSVGVKGLATGAALTPFFNTPAGYEFSIGYTVTVH